MQPCISCIRSSDWLNVWDFRFDIPAAEESDSSKLSVLGYNSEDIKMFDVALANAGAQIVMTTSSDEVHTPENIIDG